MIHDLKRLTEEAESRMEQQGIANLLRKRQLMTNHYATSEHMAGMHSAASTPVPP